MLGRRRELPWFAGSVLGLLVLTAVFASSLAPQNPTEGDITQKLIPPIWMEGGDSQHPLGTDRFGRDGRGQHEGAEDDQREPRQLPSPHAGSSG